MNGRQKRILQIIFAILVLMFVFPPFHEPLGPGVMGNSGFAFVLMPPESESNITPSINLLQLIVQWFGVAVIGAVAYFLGQGSDSAPKAPRTNWSVVLGLAFHRSKTWLWFGLAFIVMPVFWADDPDALAIKLVGNTGAAFLMCALAFSWHTVRVLRGLPATSENSDPRISKKRILFAVIAGAIGVGVLVLFSSKPPKGSALWERDWSTSGRGLFGEASGVPRQQVDRSAWWESDPVAEPAPGHVNWDDFTPVTPETSKHKSQTTDEGRTEGSSVEEFLGQGKSASK